MKKYFSLALAAAAAFALVLSCAKEPNITPEENPEVQKEQITISATLSEAITKVDFAASYSSGKPESMSITWATGDKIRVYDHDDRSKYEDFTLDPSCDGKKTGLFTGTAISASSYDIEVINGAFDFTDQSQPSDGVTTDLKYWASASDVADYVSTDFTSFSSVLAITAKMPSDVADDIKSVDITASDDIFNGGNTLSITFDTKGDADGDDILHFFAALPEGDQAITAGTSLIVHFNAPGTDHTVYTRYVELPATTFTNNKLNTININASNSATYANASATSIGESTNPYLIGDKYQMQAISLSTTKQYYKLVDDIDLDGVTWTSLNPVSPGTKKIDLDGNGKTISHLGKPLFDDLNGKVINLTIEDAAVDGGSSITGILANTIKTAASTVNNVDITGTATSAPYTSSVTSTKGTGGLIGEIDNVGGVIMATISDCDITYTSVKGVGVGGLLYFANAKVSIDNCSYSGATISSSGRYIGGMIGSTANYASVISNCRVENSTISSSLTTNDQRLGGIVGLLHTSVEVQGCTVGTELEKVNISLPTPSAADKKYNAGGFVGVCYGTVTKYGTSVRNKAFVKITSSNPSAEDNAGYELNLGGFVGYLSGTVEYSDAVVTMDGICGKYVGGFCGRSVTGGTGATISNSTVSGTVSGNSATGGFVGYAEIGEFTECTSSATVSRTGSWGDSMGAFGGIVKAVTMTKCHATSNISINANYIGGFLGGIETNASTTTTIQKCWSTGNVASSAAQCGGFIGHVVANAAGTVNISDCYETGNVTLSNQRRGGFIGQVGSGKVTISRCYASGTVNGSFALGGFIGFMNTTATIEDCAAWNASVTAGTNGPGNWSSAAVIGVTWPVATITNCFRNPDMSLLAYWGNATGYTYPLADDYDHDDVSSSSALVKQNGNHSTATSAASGQDGYPQFPYHGKHSTTNKLSTLASTAKVSGGLGWSDLVWDFSASLPTLK